MGGKSRRKKGTFRLCRHAFFAAAAGWRWVGLLSFPILTIAFQVADARASFFAHSLLFLTSGWRGMGKGRCKKPRFSFADMVFLLLRGCCWVSGLVAVDQLQRDLFFLKGSLIFGATPTLLLRTNLKYYLLKKNCFVKSSSAITII